MEWNSQQAAALKAVSEWLADPRGPQCFRLFGYAGVGKTTLARHLSGDIKGPVLFGAFTGKASLVLRQKGCAGASTIHSMIYKVEEGPNGTAVFKINRNSDVASASLVIIDECSMVDDQLGGDLLSFGTKVLVLGDPFQLPPIGKGTGFFTAHRPDIMLTDVKRQAADNPIIYLSMRIREGYGLQEAGDYGETRIIRRSAVQTADVLAADQVIVGLNRSRRNYNRRIRSLLGFNGAMPEVGDRLICLRNDKDMGLINGGMFEATTDCKVLTSKGLTMLKVKSLDDPNLADPIDVTVYKNFWDGTEKELDWRLKKGSQEFDFARAITCHKAQGSQWPSIYLFDESSAFREDADRWIYTAVTRAAERATIVLP